jgi:hypothetical protein
MFTEILAHAGRIEERGDADGPKEIRRANP